MPAGAIKQEWTRDLAYAASIDAANANMRKHGRTVWSIEDWNFAVETFNRLFPDPMQEQRNG